VKNLSTNVFTRAGVDYEYNASYFSMSSSWSTTSTKMISVSTAAVAVVAATAMSYCYRSSNVARRVLSTTSRATGGSADRLDDWGRRWIAGQTRWHDTAVHSSLQKYGDEALVETVVGGGARVLVPLCGKTVDMAFLARKRPIADVVGVEGIRQAIEAFVVEQPDLSIQAVDAIEGFQKYRGESITLLTGDFFNVTTEVAGGLFDGVWDRGALVAIDPSLRDQYLDTIGNLMVKPHGRYLLASIVRTSGDTMAGPPFSIDEAEVRRLFGSKSWVESIQLLDSHVAPPLEPWYKAVLTYFHRGSMREEIYLICTK
jgi:thiopurine S-methyltransferase